MIKIAMINKWYGIIYLVFFCHTSFSAESRFQPITEKRIQQDMHKIDAFLIETTDDVCKASEAIDFPYYKGTIGKLKPSAARKQVAYTWHGISSKAYDCIPFAFFNDTAVMVNEKKNMYDTTALLYMNNGKAEFVKNYLRHGSKDINKSTFAEFSFDYLVDHLSIPQESKAAIKNKPLIINQIITTGTIRAQYMRLTFQNLIIQYYLEQEVGKRK